MSKSHKNEAENFHPLGVFFDGRHHYKEAAVFTNNSLLSDKWQQPYSIILNYTPKNKVLTAKTPERLSLGFCMSRSCIGVFEESESRMTGA